MAEAALVRPSRKFVEELIASGGGDLKKCMQCANCSVMCELSDGRPFPRKEMIWAQWGLEDRLVTDPDVWLCHQCNDCSLHCPRGARPGDVLAAIRRHVVQYYAMPSFLARWVNQARFLPLTFLFPVALVAVLLMVRDPIGAALSLEAHGALYADFFPHWLLIASFGGLTTITLVLALVALGRFWRAMGAADEATDRYAAAVGVGASLWIAVRSILTHERFGCCTAQHSRRLSHLAVFYGFGALFVVTVWAVVDLYAFPFLGIEPRYPFGLMHPMKILANLGGVALIFGAGRALMDRTGSGKGVPSSTAFDWTFLWVVLGVGATGFATEILRFTVQPGTSAAPVAYGVYVVHLVLVFHLLVYLPYSKFAHVLYRTVAMAYGEHTGRYHPVRKRSEGRLPSTPQRSAVTAGGSARTGTI